MKKSPDMEHLPRRDMPLEYSDYTVKDRKREYDVDDLIFDEEEWYASDR